MARAICPGLASRKNSEIITLQSIGAEIKENGSGVVYVMEAGGKKVTTKNGIVLCAMATEALIMESEL